MTFSKGRHITALAAKALVLALMLAVLPSPVAAQGRLDVRVQGAQQTRYARLAFALPDTVTYTVDHQGTRMTLRVDGNVAFDFSQILANPLVQVKNPGVSYAGSQTVVVFDVPRDASVRDFRSGQYLVLDVYSDNASTANQTAQRAAQPAATTQNVAASTPADAGPANADARDQPPSQQEDQQPAQAQGSTAPDDNQPAQAGGQDDTSVSQQNGQSNSPVSDGATDIDPAAVASPSAEDAAPPPVTGAAGGDGAISPVFSAIEGGVQIRFPWTEDVAAAAFERGGYLWLVFDKAVGLDGSGVETAADLIAPIIRGVDVQPHQDALVIRMAVNEQYSTVVEKDRNDWLVLLKDTPAKPRFPLAPQRQNQGAQGQQIYIATTGLGRKIEIEDPAIGDLFVVLPTTLEGRGMPQHYSYASSEVLESAQGVIVLPLSDFVLVERFAEGVAIRSAGNDALSASNLSRETGIGDQSTGQNFNRLIDFKNWRIGNGWEYRKNKTFLLYELSLQPEDDRNTVRWKLARYYLAHGRAAEAVGILDRMLDQDPLLAQNSEYLAVRGVANFKMGRLEQAAIDLNAQGLEADQDAELWRALIAEARGRYVDALEHYRLGKDVMGTYDDYDRGEIQLAMVRAALQTGNIEQAQRELDLVNGLALNQNQLSESILQSARIAERQGQIEMAMTQFEDLSTVPQRWISARARYSKMKQQLRAGDATVEQAIDELERLRYSWRGNRFEAILLDDLADLYFQTDQFETGLEILRQGLSYYPQIAQEKRMLTRSMQMFRELFLEGRAADMTPIAAITLYYKFRDLTPLGNDGDLMIRRLSDRLVSVDLLGRAAELLDYQVRERTEGAARAQIAAKLAKIYILDQKPQEAMQIIRATREPRLPRDIETTRRHVESRALIELDRFDEADVILEGDRSADAEFLRADIYWGGKRWDDLKSTIRRILGDGWRRNETLTDVQRLNLIRQTIAMTFLEDRAGLIEARRRYGSQMRSGDFANAFDLLTNDQELSGRELGVIAGQIASVEKLQSFMRDYRSDFTGR